MKEVKKLTAVRVHELYDNDDLALAITTTLNVITALTEQINALEKAVLRKAKLRPEFELLRTVWGIGEILSLTIMYEAAGIARFASAGDFASYARCVDATRTSNGKKQSENNGKNGNRYLAWAFIEAAHFAVRAYPGGLTRVNLQTSNPSANAEAPRMSGSLGTNANSTITAPRAFLLSARTSAAQRCVPVARAVGSSAGTRKRQDCLCPR
ncbi:MAG TPA: IS110 family transposase [Thermoanaerobaculia bacterium]|nr:IS110 family transposase [Thermoanaerobaculia bacterium]